MRFKSTFTAVVAVCLTSASHANLINNASFEQGAFNPLGNNTVLLSPGDTGPADWQIESSIVAWYAVGSPWGLTPTDGSKWLDLSSTSDFGTYGRVAQTVATSIGQAYELTFMFGSSTRWGRPASILVSAGPASQTFVSPLTGGDDDWQLLSFSFVANSTATRIAFEGGLSQDYVGLDQVNLQAVPEPPLPLLFALGLAVVAPLAWRRRNSEA